MQSDPPKYIIFTKEDPKSHLGKILQRVLRDWVSVDLVRRIGLGIIPGNLHGGP